LVFGVAFIVSDRRILSFGLIAFSIAILVLMTCTAERANKVFYSTWLYSLKEYQRGYYLVYPSIAMFLFAFLLNEVTKKRQTTSRDTSIPVIDTPQLHQQQKQTGGRE